MSEFEQLAEKIIEAIHLAIDAHTSPSDRTNANIFIEEIKTRAGSDVGRDYALKIAVLLLNFSNPAVQVPPITADQVSLYTKVVNVHNFGLQLLEIVVKYSWNNMPASSQQELKILVESVITRQQLPESVIAHIYANRLLKDQFSRFVVELIKRVWPQEWENLFDICLSQKKNELVLYIIWRLSEDIGIFFSPPNPQRRREINNKLKSLLPQIFQYISDSLSFDNIDLTLLALQCLSTFFEWCPIAPEAISYLCNLLSIEMSDTDALFKVCDAVINCLLTVLERKSYKPDERKALIIFFEQGNYQMLTSFLEKLIPFVQIKITSNVLDEKTFDLVKKFCNIFSSMGQICLSISSSNHQLPETFPAYLQVMLNLVQHENQIYNHIAVQFWKDLVKNPVLRTQCLTENLLINLVQVIPFKITKQTQTGNIFLVYEFDGIDDYDVFFVRFKAEFTEFLRGLVKMNESVCANFMINLAQGILVKKPLLSAEWEMLATFSEAVCNNLKSHQEFAAQCLPLLDFLLSIPTQSNNPKLDSTILSCISSFTIFIPHSQNPDLLKNVLTKVFSCLTIKYEGADSSVHVRKEVVSLRRHACALFIRLGKIHSKTMISLFALLKSYIDNISEQQDTDMSQLEKCLLYEGLLTISNEFTDYLQQKDFINEIAAPMNWLLTYNMNAVEFITHIGLTSPIQQWSNYAANRSALVYAVNCLIGMIRRVNRKEALLPEILPYICSMSKLITNLNEMWGPSLQQMCNDDSREIVYAPLLETERMSLLESPFGATSQTQDADVNEPKQVARRMQTFLWILQENCYNVIGHSTNHMNPEIYENMDFTGALQHIEYVPDFKLKMMMKSFLKPLISSCPKNSRYYEIRIYPILSRLLPYLFRRINSKWEIIKSKRYATESEQNEYTTEQMEAELLEEQISRYISKEFVDLLVLLMLERVQVKKESDSSKKAEETECLSTLGAFILEKMPEMLPVTYSMITWLDSNLSIRANSLAIILTQKMLTVNAIALPNDAGYLFSQILAALGYFGEHDQNQALLLQMFIILYEGLFQNPGFEDVRSNLVQFCGGNIRSWISFEEYFLKPSDSNDLSLKRKKESLKSLLDSIIGKNLGNLYRKKREEIKNLAPIFQNKKKMDFFDEPIELNTLFENF